MVNKRRNKQGAKVPRGFDPTPAANMIRLTKLTKLQLKMLKYLVKCEQPIRFCDVAKELGMRYIGTNSIKPLIDHKYITDTGDGWIATEIGKNRSLDNK